MTTLESSVRDLKVALDDLSVRVERRALTLADQQEALSSIRDMAGTAQKYAGKAALDLATVIDEMRGLLAEDGDPDTPDKYENGEEDD